MTSYHSNKLENFCSYRDSNRSPSVLKTGMLLDDLNTTSLPVLSPFINSLVSQLSQDTISTLRTEITFKTFAQTGDSNPTPLTCKQAC